MKKRKAPKSQFTLPCQPGGGLEAEAVKMKVLIKEDCWFYEPIGATYGGIKEIAVTFGCSNWKKEHFTSFLHGKFSVILYKIAGLWLSFVKKKDWAWVVDLVAAESTS